MKTIEEKAKAYDEARERFKSFKEKYYTKDTNFGDVIFDKTGEMQKDFEQIFPELRESEDEMIRVRDFMMKQFFRPISPDLADALADAIIEVEKTVLNKKQKDSLHISESCKENADSFTSEDERIREGLIRHLEELRDWKCDTMPPIKVPSHYDAWIAYLERQKEPENVSASTMAPSCWQKEQKPAVSREKILHQLFQNGSITLSDYLYLTEEQKPAEKQDYSGLTDFERAIHRGFLCAGVENVPVTIIKETAQECMAKIKPAEWSEEDEVNIGWLIAYLKGDNAGEYYDEMMRESLADWLENRFKSLRPSWKPSEEQMEELNKVRTLNPGLDALYQQLKNM